MRHIPITFDALQAEIVPTRDRDRVFEAVQTDAALKLLLRQCGGHVSDREITFCYPHMLKFFCTLWDLNSLGQIVKMQVYKSKFKKI